MPGIVDNPDLLTVLKNRVAMTHGWLKTTLPEHCEQQDIPVSLQEVPIVLWY